MAGHLQAALPKEADGLWVSDFFLFEDTMGEGFGCVVFENGADALEDDGTIIVFLINEMDGATGDFAAVGEDGLVDVEAVHATSAEAGEEGGMNIDDAAVIARGDVEHAKPAGEADEIDFVLVEQFENGVREIGGAGERFAVDDVGGDGGLGSAVEGEDVGTGGDDDVDAGVEGFGGDSVDEILQGGAGAGGEDREVHGSRIQNFSTKGTKKRRVAADGADGRRFAQIRRTLTARASEYVCPCHPGYTLRGLKMQGEIGGAVDVEGLAGLPGGGAGVFKMT